VRAKATTFGLLLFVLSLSTNDQFPDAVAAFVADIVTVDAVSFVLPEFTVVFWFNAADSAGVVEFCALVALLADEPGAALLGLLSMPCSLLDS